MGTHSHVAAPIFIVGSPRSGTSILTWCLGQHPNILPSEESDWLGPFSLQVGAHHELGSARGERSQLSALGIERAEMFSGFGDAIDAMILGHRRRLEELNRLTALRDPQQVHAEFAVSRNVDEPKARWVDGTPEYSLYICGLQQLFPRAKFVHILRDADDVAASMLAFRDAGGRPLVADADEAYEYWERTTRACVLAAEAFGAEVVCRLRYADLLAQPEATLRDLCKFLGEPFAQECIAPLALRINSSFAENATVATQMHASSAIIERARRLSERLQHAPQAVAPSPSPPSLALCREDFAKRVERASEARTEYPALRYRFEELQQELNRIVSARDAQLAHAHAFAAAKEEQLRLSRRMLDVCGIVLCLEFAAALAVLVASGSPTEFYAICAGAGMLIYAWMRRAGLRKLWSRSIEKPNAGSVQAKRMAG